MKMFLISLILFASFSASSQSSFDQLQTKSLYQPEIINISWQIESLTNGNDRAVPLLVLNSPKYDIHDINLGISKPLRRVSVWKSAGIGALIGAGIGGLVGFAAYTEGKYFYSRSFHALLFGGGGLLIGTGLGVAIAISNNEAYRKSL